MTKAVRIGWLPLAVIAAALIALGGWLAVAPSTQAQATSVVVAATDANVAVGGTGDSNITVTPTGVTVGALDLTVTYDSTLASATCATTFGVCNAALTPGTVTFSLAQVSGISGTAGTITFTGVAAGNSPIAVTINTCADDQGADITTCTATNGTLTVSVETATPTPSPTGAATETPTPTPTGGASGSATPTGAAGSVTPSPSGSAAAGTPTRTPAGLPTTGGSDSGTDALPYILGLIGLAVVGAGAWAAVRSRRAAR